MVRILVTGASGFIGRYTIPLLVDKGYEVHSIYYSRKPDFEYDRNKNLFLHFCDLLNLAKVKELISEIKPTHLLHFAWCTSHKRYWTDWENIRWVQASLELFFNFAENGGERAVVAGTCAEYDWSYGFLSEYITPEKPKTLYGICKNSLYRILSQFSNQAGISLAWGRIFFVYGPYEHQERLVPSAIISLIKDVPKFSFHGNKIRDFLYVEDVASAFSSILESNVEGPINIASGQPLAIKTIVYTISELLGKTNTKLEIISETDDDPVFLVADVRRLKNEVGWEPKVDLEKGLMITIEWWKRRLGQK